MLLHSQFFSCKHLFNSKIVPKTRTMPCLAFWLLYGLVSFLLHHVAFIVSIFFRSVDVMPSLCINNPHLLVKNCVVSSLIYL